MAYIFRLHLNGSNTNTDWALSQPYGANVISQIVPPNGQSAKTEITSIPSPFARIALVKSAFGEVAKSGNLDGNTIYHKMVSDSLDVAEIFFNYARLKNKFNIIVWDAQTDLAALQQTHPQVYGSLDVFLKQDANVYNFSKMQRLYILVYTGQYRNSQMDVVGATSPASLFFTPANDLSYLSQDISFGQDHPFDRSFQPLYKRDSKFVEYLFTFRIGYGEQQFAIDFPEVNDYLDKSFQQLPQELIAVISNIQPTALGNYQQVKIDAANAVEVLGYPLHQKPLQTVVNSDFTIANSHYTSTQMPLVLPVIHGTTYANLTYVQDKWGSQNAAPPTDSNPWQQRVLPFDGTPYPYLTMEDFLEDTILLYGYKANTEKFFFGNWDNADVSSVMLPVKPLFFQFFTIDQLVKGINGTPMLKMSKLNEQSISVVLNIPIKGGSISYTKNYYQHAIPNAELNKGSIKTINDRFGLAMLPMIQTNNPYYRIAIAHDFDDAHLYKLECYRQANKVEDIHEIVRNKTDNNYYKTHIYAIDTEAIDYIRIGIGNNYGIVAPSFSNTRNNLTYTFAIDFGTTNTHIEYTDGNMPSATFVDQQLTYWADHGVVSKQIFEADMCPHSIGDKFYFPTRTALSESSDTDWTQLVIPLAQTNIPLVYGHREIFNYNTITTDIKWSNDPKNIKRVESYIDNLMLLMRNKVLLEGGQLDATKIIWFYPGSMTQARRNAYKKVWTGAYQKYFGNNTDNICATLESVAPYEYFRRITPAASRMVSVDIGGGTTDVVIAQGGSILYTTSFRFAANTIFGNGYTNNAALNGIVARFIPEITKRLENNKLEDLSRVFSSLQNSMQSTDIASFFFSMKNDDKVKEKKVENILDWNAMLQQDELFKVVFLLFYTAIIYHVAFIMKAKNLQPPRHMVFSGNGSKVVTVLSTSTETLADYTKDVFCRVYGLDRYDNDGLEIILPDQPKVATCKGGLSMMQAGNVNVGIGEKLILKSGMSSPSFYTDNDTYSNVNEALKKATLQDVRDFLSFIFEKKSKFSLKDNFGIDQQSLTDALDVCSKDLDTFLDNGLQLKLQENGQSGPIEESLFFYPIVGMLYALCANIYSKNPVQFK